MLPSAAPRHSHLSMAHEPRKSAKQQRSRVTIDAILEATARIVGQVGLDQATTNRIAELAGVSIGSLYQYFPGKEALLAALIAREAEADLEALRRTLADLHDLPLADAVERLITVLVARHARHPALYRWMLTYTPGLGQHPTVRSIAARGRALLRDLLGAHQAELPPHREPALAAMILGSAVESAVHAAIFERPETLTDGTLARELTALCRAYLTS